MARPNLSQGIRLLLSSNGTVWEEAVLLTSLSGLGGFSAASQDTTNLSSDEMEHIKGLSDANEISVSLQFDSNSDFDTLLNNHRDAYGVDASLSYKVLVPFVTTPATFSGTCFITDYSGIETSVNSVATASLTFKPIGAPTVTAGATT